MPPCGGVPYCSASMKKPKRSRVSSSVSDRILKIFACSAESWMRRLPPPTSVPFSTMS